MILSSWSNVSLEEVSATGGNGLRWLQISLMGLSSTMEIVKRAEMAGYEALVVTVDSPVRYLKKIDIKNGFTFPSHLSVANFASSSDPWSSGVSMKISWEYVDWLRSITSLPIVLKGILRADDAKEALKHDVQAILISNHGARQLDTVCATVS